MFNKSKYGKLVAITAFLSVANVLLNSSIVTAQVNNRKKRLPIKISTLNTVKKQAISQNLFFPKSSNHQNTKKAREQDHSKISKNRQIILSEDQLLIANSVNGNASWYGPGFDGRLTANGETFDQQEMTAAHPDLKFGTKVKVTNLQNGRSVVVRINDRGPFIRDRIIDLSAAAARALNMMSSGVAPVRLTILGQ
ncbi:MAG: septal ring lytic transglycosylase RlpA family protein [Pleurocapsa minor HA4230-MV1]|jgi:rare lipoprotein A|nr:septal ring lytic transglycosylase RlpA family protein [Pleurocapsa minor HA4230-MV1]